MRIATSSVGLSHQNNFTRYCISPEDIALHPIESERMLLQAIASIQIPTPDGYEIVATVDCETAGSLKKKDGSSMSVEHAMIRIWFDGPQTEGLDSYCCLVSDMRWKHFFGSPNGANARSVEDLSAMLTDLILAGIEKMREECFEASAEADHLSRHEKIMGNQLSMTLLLVRPRAAA